MELGQTSGSHIAMVAKISREIQLPPTLPGAVARD
jgi:hypothetical protein